MFLPEDILHMIYRKIHTIDVIPELKEKLDILRIEQCIKAYPFVKSLSFIAKFADVEVTKTRYIINNSNKIYGQFNNLYNTTFYFHIDNISMLN